MRLPAGFFWFKLAWIAFGLLFFVFHLFLATIGVRSARTADDRLEAAGAIMPGVAGLLIAATWAVAWTLPPFVVIGLLASGIFVLVFGRATYEGIVFRPRR